ncbi:MAG: spermidine synthase [Proteobacteria bacterium]|nr:spermidine synthase [Pseudomonadota bacterium]HQR03298.1 spermidine synthase [Rhodocyclaceae bacterium]
MSFDIDISEEAGVRYLHFGSDWIQGAMRIARPWALELEYTREMMAALLLRPGAAWPRRALVIGLGAGSVSKFLYRHRPEMCQTVVEIEPAVVAAAHHHFRLPDDPHRLAIKIGDGAQYVMKPRQMLDLILVDGFDPDARSGDLDTLPFYLNCRARLGRQGLMVCNLLSRRKDFRASIDRIREAFEGRILAFPSCDSGNAIAFAAVGDPVELALNELKASARELKKETGLNLLPTLSRLEQSSRCPGGILRL